MRKLEPDVIIQLVELYRSGQTANAIAKRFRIHKTTLYEYLKQSSIPPHNLTPKHPYIIYKGRKFIQSQFGYYMTSARPALVLHKEIWKDNYGVIPDGCHIHHKDHDKANNNIDNLMCLTQRSHASHHHLGKIGQVGQTNPLSKLTDEQVQEIRAKYSPHRYSQSRLASEYGVSQTLIGLIVRKQIWKHLE